MGKTYYPLKPQYFDLAHMIQHVTFLAFTYHKMNGPHEGCRWLRDYMEKQKMQANVYDYQIRFSAELWPPREPELREKVMEVYLRMDTRPEIYQLRFDFRQTMFAGVELCSGDGHGEWQPFNVFDVEFREGV